MPEIADDGCLFYTHHESYVISATWPKHPLKFRSVDWHKKTSKLKELSQNNVFIGSHLNHDTLLEDVDAVSVSVGYNSQYLPLLKKSAEMFNMHHDQKFKIDNFENLENFYQPAADLNIDLLEIFSRECLLEFLTKLKINPNQRKIDFIDTWLYNVTRNKELKNIIENIRDSGGMPERSIGAHC
jgi:hypothetical protein